MKTIHAIQPRARMRPRSVGTTAAKGGPFSDLVTRNLCHQESGHEVPSRTR